MLCKIFSFIPPGDTYKSKIVPILQYDISSREMPRDLPNSAMSDNASETFFVKQNFEYSLSSIADWAKLMNDANVASRPNFLKSELTSSLVSFENSKFEVLGGDVLFCNFLK